MISLFMFVVFAIVIGRLAGASLRMTSRSEWNRRRRFGVDPPREPPPLTPPPPAPVETPLEVLQRQFANGEMSVEQYERELNRMYGIRG